MKHAVVTGGASGLGLALATRLHHEGWAWPAWPDEWRRSDTFSPRGLSVVLTEAVLFLPAWAYAFWPRAAASPAAPS